MALIKSISGIRGTIGGRVGENLTPSDIVKFSAAYGKWLKQFHNGKKIIIGRDGRISGDMVSRLVTQTLLAMGIDVADAGLSTTPTIEMAVLWEKADGGIIITASHNPKEWNALKLLNSKGEFISAEDGAFILEQATLENFDFAPVSGLGQYSVNSTFINRHIDAIVNYKWVDVAEIKKRNLKVVVDVINSTGVLSVPPLLQALGVENFVLINQELNGNFAHNPEPLPEHLTQLCEAVKNINADLGIAVDPDVDRLCFVNEDGSLFGEEYTLVAVADYILGKQKGNTVSNLSSTRALKDVTLKYGCQYTASAVGEVNVVKKMKAVNAVVGGEGNGGIIIPELHYGRDALAGMALFLSAFALHKGSATVYRKTFPDYFMSKKKMTLDKDIKFSDVATALQKQYHQYPFNSEDGLKIEMENSWVHLRSSNTEPIIRIYTESFSQEDADRLADEIISHVEDFCNSHN